MLQAQHKKGRVTTTLSQPPPSDNLKDQQQLESLVTEHLLQAGLGDCAGNLLHDFSVLEKDQGRNGTDSVFARSAGVFVNIHLDLCKCIRNHLLFSAIYD